MRRKKLSKPATGSRWVRVMNRMRYMVLSVDERGVFLEADVGRGICRLPLKRFHEQFQPLEDGGAV